MKQLREITKVRIEASFDLNTGYRAVVQKGNVGTKYIYALQLRKSQHETYVLRGNRKKVAKPILILTNQAAGHTQTWEYAGRAGQWFIGTKPGKGNWAKQIARVDLGVVSKNHKSNTDFPRLAYLNRAGKTLFVGDLMTHAEVAVSPDYRQLLLLTLENKQIAHFTIFDLKKINAELDTIGSDFISLEDFPYLESFTISNFNGIGEEAVVNSIQGIDLDNEGNIYLSSQRAPQLSDGKWKLHHKQIIKIPHDARSESLESNWQAVNLSKISKLDLAGKHSELEGIQIIGEDHCYLTVAYHEEVDGSNKTVLNKIYKLSW